MTKEEILNEKLSKVGYHITNFVNDRDKYIAIMKAFDEYGHQCLEAARSERAERFPYYDYDTYEDYLKEIEDES